MIDAKMRVRYRQQHTPPADCHGDRRDVAIEILPLAQLMRRAKVRGGRACRERGMHGARIERVHWRRAQPRKQQQLALANQNANVACG